MRLRPVLAAAASLLAACATLPPERPLAPPVKYQGAFYTFPSGLRLVVYDDPNMNNFMFDVSYRVGASDEPRGKEGLAHLVEHMAFEGRPHGKDKPKVFEDLLGSGLMFNAFTSWDNTDYWEIGKPDQFLQVVQLEAERMRNPLANVDEKTFEAEREVVVSEIRQRDETSPEGQQLSWLLAAALPNSPYGRMVGGTPESIRNCTLDDVKKWFADHYTPDHAVVVVSGPKASKQVEQYVIALFGKLALGDGKTHVPPVKRVPPPMPADPPADAPMIVKKAPVERPRLYVAWTAPGEYAGKAPQAYAASAILNAVLTHRLVREEQAESVSVFPLVLDGVTLIVAQIDLNDAKDGPKVLAAVKDNLDYFVDPMKAKLAGLTQVEVRGELLTQSYLQMESLYAPPIAQYLRRSGQPDYVRGFQQEVRAGLGTAVDSYSYEWLNRKRAVALLVAPEEGVAARPSGTGGGVAGAEDLGDDDTPLPPGTHDAKAVARPPGLDKAARFTLPNGLKVVVAKRGEMPLVDAQLIVKTAVAGAGGTSPALPTLAVQSSVGTLEDTLHARKVGAQADVRFDTDHVLFGEVAASGNLPHVLDDLSHFAKNADVDSSRFSMEQRQMAAELAAQWKRPSDRAQVLLDRRLYPDHPYGAYATPAEVRALAASDARRWLGEQLRPENATLVVVGEVEDGEALRAQLTRFFGDWKAAAPARAEVALTAPAAPKVRTLLVVDRPGATQAEISIGLRLPVLEEQDDAALGAMSWWLQKRFMKILREELGVTYGVGVSRSDASLASDLTIRAAVEHSAAAKSLAVLLREVDALGDKPLPDAVAQRAQWQVARTFAMRFDTVRQAAGALAKVALFDRPADYWEKYPDGIAALTPAAMQAAAKRMNLGAETVVIVGEAKTLKPQLEAAGFKVELAPAPSLTAAK